MANKKMEQEAKKQDMSWGALMFDACPKCGRKLKLSLNGLWFHGQKRWPEGRCKFVIKDARKAEIVAGIEREPVVSTG